MAWPRILAYWKQFAILALAGAVLLLWQADRRSQYQLGVSDTKAAIERAISQSRELINEEKNAARDAASDAARLVCRDRGIDPAECADL